MRAPTRLRQVPPEGGDQLAALLLRAHEVAEHDGKHRLALLLVEEAPGQA